MIPHEIERLIYKCIMDGEAVIIAPNDGYASERFKEIRKAVIVAANEARTILGKAEIEIIYGQAIDDEPIGLFSEVLDKAVQIDAEIETEWADRLRVISKHFTHKLRNNYRKLNHLPLIRRSRCRWRPRESRRSLDGLSPGVVVVDELHEWVELVRR